MWVLSHVFTGRDQMLCMCHINKAILTESKSMITITKGWDKFYNCWHNFLASFNEDKYNLKKSQLVKMAKGHPLTILEYFDSKWFPIVEKYMRHFSEYFVHFGHHTTSRVKGAHIYFLERSVQDLSAYFKAFKPIDSDQSPKFECQMAKKL